MTLAAPADRGLGLGLGRLVQLAGDVVVLRLTEALRILGGQLSGIRSRIGHEMPGEPSRQARPRMKTPWARRGCPRETGSSAV